MNEKHELGSIFIVYVATLLFFAVGAITTPELLWYRTLALPSWSPGELFVAAVWCVLFVLAAFSMSAFWDASPRDASFTLTAKLYAGNAALILLWDYIFFGLHRIDLAFWVSVLVAVSVAAIMMRVRSVSKKTLWLLAPYLLWVLFAAYYLFVLGTLNS